MLSFAAQPSSKVSDLPNRGIILSAFKPNNADRGVSRRYADPRAKVYAVPLLSPVITCVVAVLPALLSTPPAGLEITA